MSSAETTIGSKLAHPVICVVGATASGKTDLAVDLGLALGGQVVSADSMQVYRGMDIGTGKLPQDQRLVPHHGFDLVDPGEPYSAALFQPYARTCFKRICDENQVPILCGGTGFYVRAAIDAYEFPPGEQVENPVRERWTSFAQEQGAHALWVELEKVDPRSAAVIHENNVKRVIRAFEMLSEGSCYADQLEALQTIPQALPAVFIGLEWDRDVLYDRINRRVDHMIELGLVEEVQGLLNQGFREGITAPQAIGYKEIVSYLDGNCTLDEAVEQIKMATRRYAKRQGTWFRKDMRITWLYPQGKSSQELLQEALEIIQPKLASGIPV